MRLFSSLLLNDIAQKCALKTNKYRMFFQMEKSELEEQSAMRKEAYLPFVKEEQLADMLIAIEPLWLEFDAFKYYVSLPGAPLELMEQLSGLNSTDDLSKALSRFLGPLTSEQEAQLLHFLN